MSELTDRRIVEQSIYLIRQHKVMLDEDLAKLYGVETGALIRAVQRNITDFPRILCFNFQKKRIQL